MDRRRKSRESIRGMFWQPAASTSSRTAPPSLFPTGQYRPAPVGAIPLESVAPDAWTQFAGWSPDGRQAIVLRVWQHPDNARWEEEHKAFRMEPDKWMLDSCLLDLASGKLTNLTAIQRVSHYNGGLFFLPEGRGLGFTPLINGVSKPFVMDMDGRNKRDVSGKDAGFTYGYSASPDGKLISYHEDFQVFIAHADGSEM